MINVKAFAETLEGKPVAVLGLGMSNMAAIEALKKQKVKIDAWQPYQYLILAGYDLSVRWLSICRLYR